MICFDNVYKSRRVNLSYFFHQEFGFFPGDHRIKKTGVLIGVAALSHKTCSAVVDVYKRQGL